MGEPAQKGDADGRFEFGENWSHFLSVLDEDRIAQAQRSLKQAIGTENLNGKSFLDIDSGSVLFSLAARRLGARVYSGAANPENPLENRSAKPPLWRKTVKLSVKDEQARCDKRLRLNVLAQKRTDALQKA